MKTRQDNNMINCISMVYVEDETKLSSPIEPSEIYDENHKGQWNEWPYKCGVCRKQYWAVMANRTGCQLWRKLDRTRTWLMVWMQSIPKMKKARCQLWRKLDRPNYFTNRTDVVYIKYETELSWPIESGTICDENQIEQQRELWYRYGLRQKRYQTIMTDQTRCSLWWKLDRTMTWSIIQVWSTSKTILNYLDWSDRMPTLTNTR